MNFNLQQEDPLFRERFRESEHLFRNLVTQSPIAMAIFKGRDMVIDMANNAILERLWGRTQEEVIGKRLLEVFPELEEQKFPELMMKVYETGVPHREMEVSAYIREANGLKHFYLDYDYTPLFDLDKKVYGILATVYDVTERKENENQLEAQVQERTKALQRSNDELRKSNEELAQFAYVASHDLQEPLRKIQTFASRLLDTEYPHLSDKGKDYFARMQAAAQRMRQLIEDLLAFSRTSNTGDQLFEYVDLTQVVQRVKEQLSDLIEKKEAQIEFDLLPVLSAIPFQMEQLFTNLVNNALKFSRGGVKPLIKIRMEDDVYTVRGGIPYHKISIADNGIGFDPQFSERIFQVFQRLHVRNQFEGTGIGLAICKKIMDNHNGFITAEGRPGEGAVFTLLFPAV